MIEIEQGYLIYANNNSKCNYVRQAYALALSIKLYNKDAHITVVTENEINEQYKKIFDDIIVPRESPVSQSVLNAEQRCHAFNISPYLKTIVLDADMLVRITCLIYIMHFIILKNLKKRQSFIGYNN